MKRISLFLTIALVAAGVVFASTSIASASHAWGNYHWSRTSNPFTLKLGDNVSSAWDSYLATASSDWTNSPVLDTTIVAGSTTGRRCRAASGRVEVCDANYGFNGWLGVAQIWVSGSHITAGTVKLNDSYFNTSTYNTPAWRSLVVCQEVGHTFGLGHQDENFDNTPLGSCMDYSADPNPNQHPNAHDYEQLEAMYAHLDSFNSYDSGSASSGGGGNGRGNGNGFGAPPGADIDGVPAGAGPQDGDVFVKDLGNGNKVITHVFWVRPGNPR